MMKLNEWNQMFIDSIEHWETDALERLEEGHFLNMSSCYDDMWSDCERSKIDNTHCGFCQFYKYCYKCPINSQQPDINCCAAFENFFSCSCIKTAKAMIDYLCLVSQNKATFEVKSSRQ